MKATKKQIKEHVAAYPKRDDIELALELDVEPEVIAAAREEIAKEAPPKEEKPKPAPAKEAPVKEEPKAKDPKKREPKYFIRNKWGIVLPLVRKNASQDVMLFELKEVEAPQPAID